MRQQWTEPAAIEAEIAHLRSLALDALRRRWRAMFGRTPPAALSKHLLGRMIAWRLQEQAFGGLDRESLSFLESLARHGGSRCRRLKPGTVLVRDYHGQRHTVTVVPDGFDWQRATYASLSAIARAITGTSWRGPGSSRLRDERHPSAQQGQEKCAWGAAIALTLREATSNRLRQQLVDEETGAPVGSDHKARGYEVAKGHYLIVADEELDAIEIESTHTIEIDSFVPRSHLDQRFLDTPYYIIPSEPVGQEAFAVIREAMRGKPLPIDERSAERLGQSTSWLRSAATPRAWRLRYRAWWSARRCAGGWMSRSHRVEGKVPTRCPHAPRVGVLGILGIFEGCK
jgi:Protein of unknown function (DUF2924)/Ku70/Ku80 beta-barrel domain